MKPHGNTPLKVNVCVNTRPLELVTTHEDCKLAPQTNTSFSSAL